MRILIVRNSPNFMDVKHNTYNIQEVGLARAMVRRGHVCDIVFWAEKDEDVKLAVEEGKEITIFYRRGRSILKNAIYDNLDDLIAHYDVVQSTEYNQLQAWLLAKKYPKKTVIYHGPYYCEFNKRYNAMCRVFDLLCLGSYHKRRTPFIAKSKLAEQFLGSKGIENVKTIGVGIDLDALTVHKEDRVPQFIENIQHTEDTINLLYIGRFEKRRNIPFIYEIAAELKKRNVKFQLIMVGTGDGEYLQMCQQKAKELDVEDVILHTSKMEQKYLSGLYAKCDCFLLPTHYEIFGMVLLEAMYYGLVCLTTENGGSDMLIQDGETGFVLPLDVKKWCDTILNSGRSGQIRERASASISENYTWNALADAFEASYAKVQEDR